MHLCRGHFKSTCAASGSDKPVAEALLSEMNVDAYFLQYDDDRSGDFKPLRYLPKGRTVVLGLVTTQLGALESKDDLKRRIGEAVNMSRWCNWRFPRSAVFQASSAAATLPLRRNAPSCAWRSKQPIKCGAKASNFLLNPLFYWA